MLPTLAAALLLCAVVGALFAPWLAPQDPSELASLNLMDARRPPAWMADGLAAYPLGSDDQGRDLLSAVLFGLQVSLAVAVTAVLLSLLVGIAVGLWAGWAGGVVDAVLMRLCDVALSFPSLLVALLVDGVARALWPEAPTALALAVLVLAIALTGWVPYARTVRAATRIERGKDYVSAARLLGLRPVRLLRRHVLPNVLQPVLVLGTLQVGSAIVLEATLSFLGVGVPPTAPSLGTLIRNGNDFLFSGEWWIFAVPGAALLLVAVSINLIGDALRDAFDPRLGRAP
ncbi:ABC transporter permease [Aquabacterium sp. J223]|nr:ABC transporter permease [Aquabacterium sp. J223]UUX97788.1 ABC transporter permease [Aquabacterium sp. J223]